MYSAGPDIRLVAAHRLALCLQWQLLRGQSARESLCQLLHRHVALRAGLDDRSLQQLPARLQLLLHLRQERCCRLGKGARRNFSVASPDDDRTMRLPQSRRARNPCDTCRSQTARWLQRTVLPFCSFSWVAGPSSSGRWCDPAHTHAARSQTKRLPRSLHTSHARLARQRCQAALQACDAFMTIHTQCSGGR